MKILIVGQGYVGKALKLYLSTFTYIFTYDKKFDKSVDYSKYDHIFICVNTDYNYETNKLDTKEVTSVINDILKVNKTCNIYIKSTVNIGYCDEIVKKTKYKNIFYVPEFLREANAREDVAFPSRLVVGTIDKSLKGIEEFLSFYSIEIPHVVTGFREAESIKLFSNVYLASRVAFFNEIDTFARKNNLDSNDVIKGISLDSRIGDYYNKPSFGFGGYCLPKDSLCIANEVGGKILSAPGKSNLERKKYLVDEIVSRLKGVENPLVGVYKIKERYSPLEDIIMMLSEKEIGVMLYEPSKNEDFFLTAFIDNDLKDFKEKSNLIITENMEDILSDVNDKIFRI